MYKAWSYCLWWKQNCRAHSVEFIIQIASNNVTGFPSTEAVNPYRGGKLTRTRNPASPISAHWLISVSIDKAGFLPGSWHVTYTCQAEASRLPLGIIFKRHSCNNNESIVRKQAASLRDQGFKTRWPNLCNFAGVCFGAQCNSHTPVSPRGLAAFFRRDFVEFKWSSLPSKWSAKKTKLPLL